MEGVQKTHRETKRMGRYFLLQTGSKSSSVSVATVQRQKSGNQSSFHFHTWLKLLSILQSSLGTEADQLQTRNNLCSLSLVILNLKGNAFLQEMLPYKLQLLEAMGFCCSCTWRTRADPNQSIPLWLCQNTSGTLTSDSMTLHFSSPVNKHCVTPPKLCACFQYPVHNKMW